MRNDVFNYILKKSKNSKDFFLIDEKKSYKDFYNTTKLFQGFFKKNIKKKSVICVCANYSLNFVSLIFAAYLNKCIITIINPSASNKEKFHIIKNTKANFVFYEKKLLSFKKKENFFQNLKYIKLNKKKNSELKSGDRLIIYTSGTSQKPKGVVITNRGISANIFAVLTNLKLKKSDTSIIFSPPSYAMAISQILTYMAVGCKVIFYRNGLKFPIELIEKIKEFKISVLNVSVSAFRILNKYIKIYKKFNDIRIVMSGGMPMTNLVFSQYKRYFPKAKIINFYGCTENSPRISHYEVPNIKKNVESYFPVGKPLLGIKIKLQKLKLFHSNVGKIFISGTSLMRSYYKNKKLNKKLLINNWYDTGDIGFFDKDKNLNLVGREDNTFSVGHEKLCPEEIEYIIKKKISVQDFVISKIKHPILNWVPIGIGIKKSNSKLNSDIIIKKIKKDLSTYKIPKKILFVTKFPKTAYGKLDRKKIEILVNKLYVKK